MASAPTPALPNVELSIKLIGVFLNMILYGVLLVQTLTYYQAYRRCVGFLFFVETANTSLDMAMMYQPLILEYGQKPIYFPIEPLCVVLVSMPIQLFFAWRIHQLTKSLWIPVIIAVLAIASFAGGVWTAIMVQILRQFAKKPLLHNSALLWFLAACVADILITVSLVITLTKKKTGFSATDGVLDTIIRMTIQTGMITALFSILDVACFMILPANFVWDLSLSKLYSNCLMSTLNARERLNGASNQSTFRARRSVLISPVRSGPSGKQASNFWTPLGSATYDGGEDRHVSMPDLQYGIHMTKIVERIEDPIRSSTTAQ
ncbi:hypothetical protein C8R45DRAFT_1017578 [Mycena sanguinolenta]|nr:hypothetical protein C8R45DRAFT_1017578 [Mycena sanguinolenta]